MKLAIDTLGCEHARSGFGAYVLYFISNLPENLSENNIPKEYANVAKTLTNDKIFYDDIAEELNKIESPSPKQLIES